MDIEALKGLGGPMTRARTKKAKEALNQMMTTLIEANPNLNGLQPKWFNCLIDDKANEDDSRQGQ